MSRGNDSTADGGPADKPPVVSPAIAAEAALWVARLHGPSRSRKMELQCLEWQARSAAHRHAFERCTDTWMDVPSAARAGAFASADEGGSRWAGGLTSRPRRGPWMVAVAGIVGVAAALLVWPPWREAGAYHTAVGESQTIVLEDGTRMSLNTDTQVRVELRSTQRTVSLQSGEAAFEVAKDAQRPFVVRAAGSEVVAVGTVFSVRLTPQSAQVTESLAVTLIEGQVSLRPAAGGDASEVAPVQAVLMGPGDRVRLVKGAGTRTATTQQLDRPRLDEVMAWKRNEAVFDKTALIDAVAEMNRYSRTPVVLAGDVANADWRVSGQFRTGDNAAFASALAALHGLVVRERAGHLELSRGP